jgi:glutamate dehydrogenase (NAD(P)+)
VAAVPHAGFKLAGARVAVQGFGAVGKHAARFLAEVGVLLVAASDTHGTLIDSGGIDVGELIRVKDGGGSVLDYPRREKRGADAVIDVACEIWGDAAYVAPSFALIPRFVPFTRRGIVFVSLCPYQ